MTRSQHISFSSFKHENWPNLLLTIVAAFYIAFFSLVVINGEFPQAYGIDYIAFWGVGRIADEKGYAEIYDVGNLRDVQIQELNALGQQERTQSPSYAPIPVPIFSVFLLPFQLLSRLNSQTSFWVWTLINIVILVGYLFYFIRWERRRLSLGKTQLSLMILILLSFPVFDNFINGQINVFLLVCVGEFIRNSIDQKPFAAGWWLGGLLVKLQLLILIIPVILVLRYWKVFFGFIASSFVILLTSLLMSGWQGMKALVELWTKYSAGMATNAPENMINWRMVAVNLNALLHTELGWIIAILGMLATLAGVIFLIRKLPLDGMSSNILAVLAVFCATMAITWHAHYHMAMAIIPLLILAYDHHLLSHKLIFLWVVVTPLAMFLMMIVSLVAMLISGLSLFSYEGIVFAIAGFVLNLALFIEALRSLNQPAIGAG